MGHNNNIYTWYRNGVHPLVREQIRTFQQNKVNYSPMKISHMIHSHTETKLRICTYIYIFIIYASVPIYPYS